MNAAILAAVPYGRLPDTPAELVARAYDLIYAYGLAGYRAGYGSYTEGFSIEGAVFEALKLREDWMSLREAPEAVYRRTDAAFQLLAAALGQPGLKPGKAQTVVIEASDTWAAQPDGRNQALDLLNLVFAELTEAQGRAA